MDVTTTLYRAAAVRDALGVDARPGAVAVRGGAVAAAGETGQVERAARDLGAVEEVDLPRSLILPAMVNAHAHLDLTDIGPVPYGGDFVGWIEMVMARRRRKDEEIVPAVRRGLRLSREAGVGLLGDIAGSDAAVGARIDAGEDEWIDGTSYLECFGIGAREEHLALDAWTRKSRLQRIADGRSRRGESRGSIRVGLQPHAPYSAGRRVYQVVHDQVEGAATHLSESPEELQFVREAAGPLAELLRRLGKWDQSIRASSLTPVQWIEPELQHTRWVLVHCNYVSDEDIAILAKWEQTVAYCPVASEYFGHPRKGYPGDGRHRYRDMLAAGVNVCLGTDSILCQPPDEPQPLGILPQMRRLYRRDRTDPQTLLEMATTRGARALGLRETMASLQPRAAARLVTVAIDPHDPQDALVQVLLNDALATPLPKLRA